jgi:hypothetical protein
LNLAERAANFSRRFSRPHEIGRALLSDAELAEDNV